MVLQTFLPTAKEIAEELGYTPVLNQPEIEVPFYPYFYIMKEGAILQQWGGVMGESIATSSAGQKVPIRD